MCCHRFMCIILVFIKIIITNPEKSNFSNDMLFPLVSEVKKRGKAPFLKYLATLMRRSTTSEDDMYLLVFRYRCWDMYMGLTKCGALLSMLVYVLVGECSGNSLQ